MTVICISAFDKFTRFYLDIRRHLKRDQQVTFRIYSNYLSGFLYSLIRLKYSNWLPMRAWVMVQLNNKRYTSIISSSYEYKGLKYDNYLDFHLKLPNPASKSRLQKQALAYIDMFDRIYSHFKPDMLLTTGDTRLSVEIAVASAKARGIEIRYIEQGPYNRTFYDKKGVNANLSTRSQFKKPTLKVTSETGPTRVNYRRSALYRFMDITCMYFFEKTRMYPPDLKHTDVNSFRLKKKTLPVTFRKGNRFLLVCQIPSDVNTIMHSPHFLSHVDLLKQVHQNLPGNSYVVVREHPLFLGKYHKEFYSYIKQHGIAIENHTNLTSAISGSSVVIVNNSTVGFEAICLYKPTVVLGDAFYDNHKICLNLKDPTKLHSILNDSLTYTPNRKAIDKFKAILFNSVLIEGGISDKKLIASKSIARDLILKS